MNVETNDPGGLLQLPASRWAKTAQDYLLLLSALQYSLQNSILIASEQDIKCLGDIAVEPYVHQVENLKQFVNNYPQRMMLLDDVGLGKTISAGLILAELMRRRRISNFLVACPAILLDQWRQELEEKFRFRDLHVGNWQQLQPSLRTADPQTLRVITTYDAVRDHQDFFLKRKWDFVVADEGDYLKTLYSARGLDHPSGRAKTFYRMLKEGQADFFLLLTATPLRKDLWDVFNLAEITAQPGVNPLGMWRSFRRTFIADDPVTEREIQKSQQGEFRRRLTEISVRNSRREQKNLVFPERKVENFAVPLSEAKRALLDLTLDYLRQRYNFLRKIEPDQIKHLIANWKSEVEKQGPSSWEHLRIISEEVASCLGEYEFTAVSLSGERYTTGLSYAMVSQAFLAFVERIKPWVTVLTNPEQVRQFLSVDIGKLVGQFFEEEIKRRRPNILEEISLLQSVLSSPAAGAEAFRRKRAKSLTRYERGWLDDLIQRAEAIHEPEKAKRLLALAQKLCEERPQDYRLLVFTIRRETQNFLGEYLEANGFRDQVCYIRGGCPTENRRSVNDFSGARMGNGYGLPRKHILISTDAGSAGVNLQACNVMVNYDLPWVPMTIEQRIGRIQRLGQTAARVIVNNFYIADTIDEAIVRRLWERIRLFELAIGELEAILKETEGEAVDFEKQIFELTMLSKERRDEEVARRLEKMNQGEAIRRLREEQKKNEELLGTLLSNKGMPRFTPRNPERPQLDIQSFCRMAFEHFGCRTEYQPDKDVLCVEFEQPTHLFGNREFYTFTEPDVTEDSDTTGGLRLLAEGTKDFQVLLRHVLKQGGVFIRSCEPREDISEKNCLQALQQSLSYAIRPIDLKSQGVEHRIAWRLTWKITTAVARDRFQKLRQVFLPGEDKHVIEWLSRTPRSEREALPLWGGRSSDLRPPDKNTLATFLAAEVKQDDDVRGFEEHYTRVKEERIQGLEKWGNKRAREEVLDRDQKQALRQELDRRKDELQKQFTPSTEAAIAMVEGFVYRVLNGEVECTLERDGQRLQFVAAYEWTPLSQHGRVFLECRECHRDVEKEFEVCHAGHLVCTEHTARCGHPGCAVRACRRCAPDFLSACDASGVYVCAEHLKPCPSCGNRVLADLFFDVEEAEQQVCPDCFEVCEETGTLHLVGELEQSDLSGKLVHHSLLHTCPVSGKRGLAHEMEPETGTGILHAPEALVTCAVTGARVAPEKVAHSEISGKPCLPEHLQRCAVSGVLALPDELEECEETKQRVDLRLLATCQITSLRVLKRLMEPSAVSGMLGLRHLMDRDEVDSSYVLPGELETCSITGTRVTPDKLVKSNISDRKALSKSMVVCPETGQRVCPDELLTCQKTGIRAVPGCFGNDEVTGQRVLKRLLVTCAVTTKKTLPENTKECVLTGQVALTSECEQCAVTKQWVIRGKLEPSGVSGKRVLPVLLRTSAVSGVRAFPEEMERCEETHQFALPRELEACQISRKRVLPALLKTCPDTGRRFLPQYGQRCARSGELVHPDALAASDASGLVVRARLLVQSEISNRRALPEEMQPCGESGKRVLSSELVPCELTGVKVLPGFLSRCAICSKQTITRRQVQCQGCSVRYCTADVSAGLCLTCQSLKHLPLDPLDSLNQKLREAVLDAFPAAGRVAISRNAQWVFVYAKPRITQIWKGSRLLVFQMRQTGYTFTRENLDFKNY